MFGDDLNVRVTSSTADFSAGMEVAERGLSSVRSDALQTAAAMQALQGRMDEAGDEATQAGTKAGTSSTGFLGLAGSAATAEISFGSLSVMTATTLIPSLLALSTVVAPLTAALGGFVVVAGAIGGVGLAGFMGAIATNGEMLKSTFNELVSVIETEFAPMFDLFALVLDMLMERLIEIIPALVPAEDALSTIAETFLTLGEAIIGTLPAFAQLAVELTERFLPPFVEWARDLLPQIPGMLQSLIPIMLEVGAALGPMVDGFLQLAPSMTEFGMTVLNLIVPALTAFLDIWNRAMQAVNSMEAEVGTLTTKLIILGPVIGVVASALLGLSAPAIAAAAAIGALGYAFTSNFMGIRDLVMGTTRAINAFVASLQLGSIVESVGYVDNLRGAFQQLAGIGETLIDGIQPAVQTVGQTLKDNRPAIQAFFKQFIEIANGVVSVLRNVFLPAIRFVIVNYTIPLINRLARVFSQNFGDILREVTQTINVLQSRFQTFVSWMMPVWNKWGDEIKAVAKFAFDGIITALEILLTTFSTTIQLFLNLVQGDWADAWQNAKDLFIEPFEMMTEFIRGWNIAGMLANGAIKAVSLLVSIYQSGFNRLANFIGGIWNGISETIIGAVEGIMANITDGLNGIVGTLNNAIKKYNNKVPNRLEMDTMGTFEAPTLDSQALNLDANRTTNVGDLQEQNEQTIRVVLDEQTDIVQGRIEDGAEMVVEQKERRTKRNSGSNPAP